MSTMKDSFIKSSFLQYIKKPSHWVNKKKEQQLAIYKRIDEGFYQFKTSQSTPHIPIPYSIEPFSSTTLYCHPHYYSNKKIEKNHKLSIDFLSMLPVELAKLIIEYCDPETLISASYVSKYWHLLCNEKRLWKRIYAFNNQPHHHSPSVYYPNEYPYKKMYQTKLLLKQRWQLGKQQTKEIIGHTDSIYCVQFDKEKIITGSRDRSIKFWDINTGECLRTLIGHQASVLCLQYNDHFLVSGSSDYTLFIWDMTTFEIKHHLVGHTSGVLGVQLNDEIIASCSKDTTIRLWDTKTGQLLNILQGHRGPVNAIEFHGNQLVSASGDCTIKLWDMTTGKCLRDFNGHRRGLACIRFNGSTIVSGSNDNTIKVWDAEKGTCLVTCEGHTALVRTLYFDHEKIVSGSYDESIRVWDIHTGLCLYHYKDIHTSWIFDVMFDHTKIVSTSQDHRILIMDFGTDIDKNSLQSVISLQQHQEQLKLQHQQ